MEIRDLEYFLACSKAGTFTAAAREVHIVQSAMSSAIARLEHDLGVSLFDRSVTPVAVTEHGAALQAAAQRILDAMQAARDDVAAVSGQVRGTVILGCTLSTGPLDLGAVLADLRDRHPDVIIKLRQSLTGSAGNLQAVQDGSMDIALTAGTLQPGSGQPGSGQQLRGIILTPLVSEALVFVCPADHPLSRRPSVTVADLADETILRFPPGWSVRDTVDHVFGTVPSAIEISRARRPPGRSGRRCPAALEPVRRHQRQPAAHRRHHRRAPRAQPGGPTSFRLAAIRKLQTAPTDRRYGGG